MSVNKISYIVRHKSLRVKEPRYLYSRRKRSFTQLVRSRRIAPEDISDRVDFIRHEHSWLTYINALFPLVLAGDHVARCFMLLCLL